MTLPTYRASRNEEHAQRLAYALVGLIKAYGMDESTAHAFAAINEANRALANYAKDNRDFYL